MKHTFKRISGMVLITIVTALMLTSCYETRYVRSNNHHTEGWYGRRHVAPPVGVNFEVDVRRR